MASSSGSIELDSAEVYLPDGMKLGIVKNLRKLDHIRTRLKKRCSPQKGPNKVHV